MATAFPLSLVPQEAPLACPVDGKSWFSAQELADLRLPGLPRDKRKVNELARREGWAFRVAQDGSPLARARAGRGGGIEYHLQALPPAARAALVKAAAPVTLHAVPDSPAKRGIWEWFERQSDKVKAEARRRLRVMDSVAACESAGMTRSAAIAEAAHDHVVSRATIWNWLALVNGISAIDALPHLAPRRHGGGKEVDIDAEAWTLLISDYLRPEKPNWSSCCCRVRRKYCEPRGIALPIDKTLWRKFLREVDPMVVVKRRDGREAHERTTPPQIRTVAGLHAMEIVNIDGHTFDLFVQWPGIEKPIRPTLIGIQDVYSRKFLAWNISESENAVATRLAFAMLFRTHGIPKACLLDNGRAFASKWITGGAKTRYRFKIKAEETLGLLPSLAINPQWATPYHGQAKPIERMWREFAGEFAKDPEFSGAYVGNSPTNKPENYGKRAVPYAIFIARVAEFAEEWNARMGRRTEMAKGRSFNAAFDESYATAPIGRATPEMLRLALLTSEDRVKCHKEHGGITVLGNLFWSEELSALAGEYVRVRFDPDNLHSEIHVYARDDRFICTVPVWTAGAFKDADAARRMSKLRGDARRKTKAAEEALSLHSAAEIAQEYARYRPEPAILPEPQVVRPVRHARRGSAALLVAAEAPLGAPKETLTPRPVDRLAAMGARHLHIVE